MKVFAPAPLGGNVIVNIDIPRTALMMWSPNVGMLGYYEKTHLWRAVYPSQSPECVREINFGRTPTFPRSGVLKSDAVSTHTLERVLQSQVTAPDIKAGVGGRPITVKDWGQ